MTMRMRVTLGNARAPIAIAALLSTTARPCLGFSHSQTRNPRDANCGGCKHAEERGEISLPSRRRILEGVGATLLLQAPTLPSFASDFVLPYEIAPPAILPPPPSIPDRETFTETYFPNMCELNTWMICAELQRRASKDIDAYAVVVSSPAHGHVQLWNQRGGAPHMGIGGFKTWDFHVFAMVRDRGTRSSYVLDLDSALPWPCPADAWIANALRPSAINGTDRVFRTVPAGEYLARMKSAGEGSNLMESFVRTTNGDGYGVVANEEDFIRFIS